MMETTSLLLLFIAVFLCLETAHCRKSKSRFTNLKCESEDLNYAKFRKCKLNVLGRGVVGADLYLHFPQLPITHIHMNWSLWRRYNTYQPFLHNDSCNFCDLLAHPERISFAGLVLKAFQSRSNVNHTCPYNHDVIVDNLVFTDQFLRTLPLPQGDYKIQLHFVANKKTKLLVEVFFLRDE